MIFYKKSIEYALAFETIFFEKYVSKLLIRRKIIENALAFETIFYELFNY